MPRKDVFHAPDENARRLAGDLLRKERSAALATLEPGSGAPMASRVSLAAAMDGRAVFLISQLSDHFAALEADPRASMLIGTPGEGDPLRHPRLMISGEARQLAGEDLAQCRFRFLNRHPNAAVYADFADFAFWALTPTKATLNGGFAKAYRLGAADLLASVPEGAPASEASAVEHMNEDHRDAVRLYAEALLGEEAGDWRMTSFDAGGIDMIAGDETARLWFEEPLESFEDLRPRLALMAKRARATA